MERAREQISRQAFLNFASNYGSAADALMELIDNPFDYRGTRHLHIDVIIEHGMDRIFVRDRAGAGMDNRALHDWLHWGGGPTHLEDDIGQFHVGGKLAAMYLASGIQIACRAADSRTVWYFSDPAWGTRTEFADSSISELPESSPESWVGQMQDNNQGFVQITLNGLKHRTYDIDALRERITDTYQPLLQHRQCTIRVNDRELEADALPWMSKPMVRNLPRTQVADLVFVEGRIGAIRRGDLPGGRTTRVEPGIRVDFNGRKISAGEQFELNLHGRGTSQRLYGEVSISGGGLLPNQNKTGWDYSSQAWYAVHDHIRPVMDGVLGELNALAKDGGLDWEQRPTEPKYSLSFYMRWRRGGVEQKEANDLRLAASRLGLQPVMFAKNAIRRALYGDDGT